MTPSHKHKNPACQSIGFERDVFKISDTSSAQVLTQEVSPALAYLLMSAADHKCVAAKFLDLKPIFAPGRGFLIGCAGPVALNGCPCSCYIQSTDSLLKGTVMARSKKTEAIEDLLRTKRDDILRIAGKHGARNVRMFGSVVHGEATTASDIDFLLDTADETSSWFPAWANRGA